MAALRAAVVGLGRMGGHHARIYASLPGVKLVALVDKRLDKAQPLAALYGGQVFERVEDLIGRVDLATIAVPTVHHLAAARPLIEAGIPVLIEKPLANCVEQAQEIVDLAGKHKVVVQVGHTERFNPVVLAMQRMNVHARFIESHRISPFTFRSADIGVVADMMIHDIDIVLHLVGAAPQRVDAVGVSVLGPHEDVANARVCFANGCVANLTASRLALKTERKIRVFSDTAYFSIDYQKKSGVAIKKDANLDVLKLAGEHNLEDLSQMGQFDFGKMVKVEPLIVNDVEPLLAELQAFVEAVQGRRPVAVSAADGMAAVRLAADIVADIKRHPWQLPA
jgi:predicted dehydrogenase